MRVCGRNIIRWCMGLNRTSTTRNQSSRKREGTILSSLFPRRHDNWTAAWDKCDCKIMPKISSKRITIHPRMTRWLTEWLTLRGWILLWSFVLHITYASPKFHPKRRFGFVQQNNTSIFDSLWHDWWCGTCCLTVCLPPSHVLLSPPNQLITERSRARQWDVSRVSHEKEKCQLMTKATAK